MKVACSHLPQPLITNSISAIEYNRYIEWNSCTRISPTNTCPQTIVFKFHRRRFCQSIGHFASQKTEVKMLCDFATLGFHAHTEPVPSTVLYQSTNQLMNMSFTQKITSQRQSKYSFNFTNQVWSVNLPSGYRKGRLLYITFQHKLYYNMKVIP